MDSGSDNGGEPPLVVSYKSNILHSPLLLLLLTSNNDINNTAIGLALAIIVLLIITSALVSGSEVAYFSLSRQQINTLKRSKTSTGKRIIQLLEKPEYLLATILIANNLFNIAIVMTSYFVTSQVFHFDSKIVEILINTVVITFVLVLIGEIMPKVYANANNLRLATATSLLLTTLHKVFGPASTLLAKSTAFIENKLDEKFKAKASTQELDQAIEIIAEASETTTDKDVAMLKGIISFKNTTVKQIMCNRMDMKSIEYNTPFSELKELVLKWGYSRLPVYEEDVDHIKGLLYVKDLLQCLGEGDDYKWQTLIKPAFFIPENKKINDLLREFQDCYIHLAIAVDEYGGTIGLITLEDVLEEIVGEIRDEYDDNHEDIDYEMKDNQYIFDGRTMLHDVCKVMDINSNVFNGVRGDADSLAGLVLELTGHFPEKGYVVEHENFIFTVEAKNGKRIEKVKIELLSDQTETDN